MTFDLIVCGAGIVGLAHAYVASRLGLRVAVVERDHHAVGASIRNFGFVTVTGQREGATWQRARRSRDVWAEVAQACRIPIVHRGLWVLGLRPGSQAVLEAFCQTEMGAECQLHDAASAGRLAPALRTQHAQAAMYSPHELRVESREAIPKLAAWLAEQHGVTFCYGESVLEVDAPRVRTSRRVLHGGRVVLCPGADLNGVAGATLGAFGLKLTRLQMLRVRPPAGFRLPAAVMSDLSLVRYAGYSALPQAKTFAQSLQVDEAESLQHGIHLIAVQSEDGTLVVGDSHHPDSAATPFTSQRVDALILRHMQEALAIDQHEVVERWAGWYPVGHADDCLVAAPDPAVRVVVVTSGTGASTAFAIAEEVSRTW
jgi:D-hydroxyproline dehydrogenase subunit beta